MLKMGTLFDYYRIVLSIAGIVGIQRFYLVESFYWIVATEMSISDTPMDFSWEF